VNYLFVIIEENSLYEYPSSVCTVHNVMLIMHSFHQVGVYIVIIMLIMHSFHQVGVHSDNYVNYAQLPSSGCT